ncbi:hypothetical protein J0H58_16415 [bacterium]|nr:hypothetical protein [bacterium]
MSRATQHARHEQARKQHRREAKAHAREAAKRPKETFPMWFLTAGMAALLIALVVATVAR